MFDSQALTTAIGLSLLFFVLTSGASAIVEGLSRLRQKRAKDREVTLSAMLGRTAVAKDDSALAVFKGTALFTWPRPDVKGSAPLRDGRGRRRDHAGGGFPWQVLAACWAGRCSRAWSRHSQLASTCSRRIGVPAVVGWRESSVSSPWSIRSPSAASTSEFRAISR